MAIEVNTTTKTVTTQRRVNSFTVYTPVDAEPSLVVNYGEHQLDESGNLLSSKGIATLNANKQQMIDMLPADNGYGLPIFNDLYTGLRGLFDDQLIINFSGLFPGN